MTDIQSSQNKLNEKFFKDMDTVLIQRLRSNMQLESQVQTLADACGISDQGVLQELVASGVCAETLSAFRMVPLISVAWSDGEIQPAEREAIMHAANENGISTESPAHTLLEAWLSRKPNEELFEAWKDYTKLLVSSLSAAASVSLKTEVIDLAEQIAAAAGGFAGLGSVSAKETASIEEVKSVFE